MSFDKLLYIFQKINRFLGKVGVAVLMHTTPILHAVCMILRVNFVSVNVFFVYAD